MKKRKIIVKIKKEEIEKISEFFVLEIDVFHSRIELKAYDEEEKEIFFEKLESNG